MLALQHLLAEAIDRFVRRSVELREQVVHALAGFATEHIGERQRTLVAPFGFGLRARARRGDRKQLGANVHGAEQHHLLALELWPVTHHRMEERAPQLARVPFGIAKVAGELAELRERRRYLSTSDPAGRIPKRI